jgi:hypothetical protein
MANKAKQETKAVTKEKQTAQPSATSQVKTLIEDSGDIGMSALQLAQGIGSITEKMEKHDRTAALKKVRVLARKAIGGKAPVYDGRTAIYKL